MGLTCNFNAGTSNIREFPHVMQTIVGPSRRSKEKIFSASYMIWYMTLLFQLS